MTAHQPAMVFTVLSRLLMRDIRKRAIAGRSACLGTVRTVARNDSISIVLVCELGAGRPCRLRSQQITAELHKTPSDLWKLEGPV